MAILRAVPALALALLVAGPALGPPAAATHEVVDPLSSLAGTTQDAVQRMADAFLATGEAAADTLTRGPASSLAGAAWDALATIREGSARFEGALVAAGEGEARFLLTSGAGACGPMQALVEYHEAYSNEPNLVVNFAGAVGNPVLACSTGWRFAFMPREVQGSPEEGLTAYRLSPDAEIWFTLGPAGADGRRALDVRQITILEDEVVFEGHAADLL